MKQQLLNIKAAFERVKTYFNDRIENATPLNQMDAAISSSNAVEEANLLDEANKAKVHVYNSAIIMKALVSIADNINYPHVKEELSDFANELLETAAPISVDNEEVDVALLKQELFAKSTIDDLQLLVEDIVAAQTEVVDDINEDAMKDLVNNNETFEETQASDVHTELEEEYVAPVTETATLEEAFGYDEDKTEQTEQLEEATENKEQTEQLEEATENKEQVVFEVDGKGDDVEVPADLLYLSAYTIKNRKKTAFNEWLSKQTDENLVYGFNNDLAVYITPEQHEELADILDMSI